MQTGCSQIFSEPRTVSPRYSNERIFLQSPGPHYGDVPDAPAVGDLSLFDGAVSEQDLSLSQIFQPSQKLWGLSQRQSHMTQQQSQLLQKQSQVTQQQCRPVQRQFHLSQKQFPLMGPPCLTQQQSLSIPIQQPLLQQKNLSSQRQYQLLQQDYRKPLSHSPKSRPECLRYNANLHPSSRDVNYDGYNDEQQSETWSGEDPSVAESGPGCFTGDADLFEEREKETPAIRVRSGMKKDTYTPAPLIVPSNSRCIKLRSVKEIPEMCRRVFNFPYFNCVQTKVFDDVFFSDKSVVLCAPTGAGKTVVFEMAITRLLTVQNQGTLKNIKIVYMAPIKALCSEKYQDWKQKFEPLGLKCKELTGDTELEDIYELQEVNIIVTTPVSQIYAYFYYLVIVNIENHFGSYI